MGWDSSRNSRGDWQGRGYGRRHGGNWWIVPLVIVGLIILTHGWILVVPLIALAAFALFGFVLPRMAMMCNNNGEWRNSDWSQWQAQWQEKRKQHFQEWGEKHKRHFQNWGGDSPFWGEEKPKRKNSDDIEYV
jgi:hypothetical protein